MVCNIRFYELISHAPTVAVVLRISKERWLLCMTQRRQPEVLAHCYGHQHRDVERGKHNVEPTASCRVNSRGHPANAVE